MENRLMRVTPSQCTACRNCEIVCSFYHAVLGIPTPSRILTFPNERGGVGCGSVVVCLQCDSAACVAACPARALWRDGTTGAINHVPERCIRCNSCVFACPFGNMHWDKVSEYPAKCDLCRGDPVCVKFCPTGALLYKAI